MWSQLVSTGTNGLNPGTKGRVSSDNIAEKMNRVNWLWPSETKWQHWYRSTLGQIMACCLMVPRHFLIIRGGFHKTTSFKHPRDQWVNSSPLCYHMVSLGYIELNWCTRPEPNSPYTISRPQWVNRNQQWLQKLTVTILYLTHWGHWCIFVYIYTYICRARLFSKSSLARLQEFWYYSICLYEIKKKNLSKSTCPTGSFTCPGPSGSGKRRALICVCPKTSTS